MSYLAVSIDVFECTLLLLILLRGRWPQAVKVNQPARAKRRAEIAKEAVDYAMAFRDGRLEHALGAFRRIDLADNGKRDYSDAEARIAIEAALTRSKEK